MLRHAGSRGAIRLRLSVSYTSERARLLAYVFPPADVAPMGAADTTVVPFATQTLALALTSTRTRTLTLPPPLTLALTLTLTLSLPRYPSRRSAATGARSSPHISPYLHIHISPHVSPYLPTSP